MAFAVFQPRMSISMGNGLNQVSALLGVKVLH